MKFTSLSANCRSALTSEFMPKRLRATAVTLMFVGFSIGAAVGGFASAGLISRFGWQSVFMAGGVAPCAIAVLLIAFLPESIRFLLMQRGEDKKIARSLACPRAVACHRRTARSRIPRPAALHRWPTPLTPLIWVIFFMSLLGLYFLNAWLPTVIHDAGIVVEKAIVLTALFQVGGAVGSLIMGRLLDRFLSFGVLARAYLSAGVLVFLIGAAGKSVDKAAPTRSPPSSIPLPCAPPASAGRSASGASAR